MINKKNIRLFFILLFVFGLILSSRMFYFWRLDSHYSSLICSIAALGIFGIKPSRNNIVSYILFCLFYIYASLQAVNLNIFGRIMTLMPICVFLFKEKEFKSVFTLYQNFYIYTIVPSLLVYFLVVWFDINLPYKIIEPLNTLKTYKYFQYPFCVISDADYFSYFRFCGYYDEPGVVGTISGVLLIVNRWDIRNWKNIVLLFSGIFSFSLYFYVLQFLYFIFYSNIKYKIVAIISLIALFFVFQSNEYLDKFIFSRLEFSDGNFSGNNRTIASFDSWYNDFKFTTEYWIGYGKGMAAIVDQGGASYKDLIVDYGIIMFSLYILSYINMIWKRYGLSKEFVMISILVCSVIFQRPFIYDYLYLFLLLSPIIMLHGNQDKSKADLN